MHKKRNWSNQCLADECNKKKESRVVEGKEAEAEDQKEEEEAD